MRQRLMIDINHDGTNDDSKDNDDEEDGENSDDQEHEERSR